MCTVNTWSGHAPVDKIALPRPQFDPVGQAWECQVRTIMAAQHVCIHGLVVLLHNALFAPRLIRR